MLFFLKGNDPYIFTRFLFFDPLPFRSGLVVTHYPLLLLMYITCSYHEACIAKLFTDN